MAAVPIYVWNGTAWQEVGAPIPASPIKYQASAPSSPSTGDIWIDSDADVTTGSQQFQRFRFVASGGETSVSGVDANGAVLAYTAGTEIVVLNGSTLVRGSDYTATNGTSVTGLSPALVASDVLEVFSFMAFNVANTYTQSQVDGLLAAKTDVSANGLVLLNTTSVSGVASASINNVFSATYDNYLITISGTFASAETANLRLRVGGVDNSTASSYARQSFFGDVATGNAGAFRDTGNTSLTAIWNASTNVGVANIYVYRPFLATTTFFASQRGSEILSAQVTGYHNQSVSYDGFTLIANASTFTATITTYGLAK